MWSHSRCNHPTTDLAEQFLVSSLGRVTSQDRSNFCMEHDPMFQRNNALIAENRDALRHEHLNENTSIAREDMTRYTRLKGWYQYYKLKRHDLAYRWWERQPQGPEATGKLFHFASPPQDNGYWEPVEPRHRVMCVPHAPTPPRRVPCLRVSPAALLFPQVGPSGARAFDRVRPGVAGDAHGRAPALRGDCCGVRGRP